MEFTTAQITIVRNVCKLQEDSAIRVIGNRMKLEDINSYQSKHLERMIKEYEDQGFDIDETQLLETFATICQEFDSLHIEPSILPNLSQCSLRIFTKIFREYAYSWEDIYPNAHRNLEYKLTTILLKVDHKNNINQN